MNTSQFLRKAPGTRPLEPVRRDEIPDDWQCVWVYRLVSCPAGKNGTGFWELKYVNAACNASRVRLTEQDVREICAVYGTPGITRSVLAARFGVSESTIGDVAKGRHWRLA